MLLSYVLRLVPSALAEGRLAGTVQTVETGQTTAFGSVEELLRALLPAPRNGEDDRVVDLRGASTRAARHETRPASRAPGS